MTVQFNRPNIIRPPSEWKSYFLPLTSGCSNNTCTFCNYYGARLQMRELDDVKKEIDALATYVRTGICLPDVPQVVYAIARSWDGKRVFLQDGDALVYPFPRLREALSYLNESFPALERVGSYATPQDILRRSHDQLSELKKLKLSIFYMGVESGDDKVLQMVGKGVNTQELVEAGNKAKESGINLSVTVILGLGGIEGSEEHALKTAKILTDIDPDYAGALTLTLVPGTPLYREWEKGEFQPISPMRSLEELKAIIKNSNFSDCFFSSMHASNYFSVRGTLPGGQRKNACGNRSGSGSKGSFFASSRIPQRTVELLPHVDIPHHKALKRWPVQCHPAMPAKVTVVFKQAVGAPYFHRLFVN